METENKTIGGDLEGGIAERRCVFAEEGRMFWLQQDPENWFSLAEAGLRRELKFRGLRDRAMALNNETLSPVDAEVRRLEQTERVKRAFYVAGYKPGVQDFGGEKILVTRPTPLIVPRQGEWPLLTEIFRRMFVGPCEGPAGVTEVDQRARVFAWLKDLLSSLHGGHVSRGLWLHVAGEPNAGKTLLRDILVALAGGRMGKPYKWMIGKEDFNRDLFSAVLQVMDDETADTRIEARKNLAALGKQIVADGVITLRMMFSDGFTFKPMWRLLTLTNIEADALLVMPPITRDIADKILMLKAYQAKRDKDKPEAPWPMPMWTRTPVEREAFWKAIEAEFPAFVFWLLEEFEVPSHIVGDRFGVRAWQHPDILRELQQFSPEVRLWQLIESSGAVFSRVVSVDSDGTSTEEVNEWAGTAGELYDLLGGPRSKLTSEERRKLSDPSWIGQRLTALQEHWGEDVVMLKRTGRARIWRLRRNKELAQ